MKKRALFLGLLLVSTTLWCQNSTTIKFDGQNKQALIPFELYNNLVFIQARILDSPTGWFIFDTGAGITLLDSTFAANNGIKCTGSLISKTSGREFPAATNLSYYFNGTHIDGIDARVMNTADQSMVIGRKIDGIIGYDFLSHYVIEINYEKRNLVFSDPDHFTYQGQGEKLPLTINQVNWPMVMGTVNQGDKSMSGNIVFDSGGLGSISLITDELADTTIRYPFGFGINGATGGAQMGRLSSITVASFTLLNPICGFPVPGEGDGDEIGKAINEESIGTVGGEFMRKFNLTFDYTGGVIYIEPNSSFNLPIQFDMLGLILITTDEVFQNFYVIAVVPDSPADKAGMAAGDLLLEINELPASSYNLAEIRDFFKKENPFVKISYSQGDTIHQKTVSLKPMI